MNPQYSELMQNCIHPVPDGSNISFKSKRINDKKYWYLYISLGSSRREHYLGEDSTELLDRMDDERAVWASPYLRFSSVYSDSSIIRSSNCSGEEPGKFL